MKGVRGMGFTPKHLIEWISFSRHVVKLTRTNALRSLRLRSDHKLIFFTRSRIKNAQPRFQILTSHKQGVR